MHRWTSQPRQAAFLDATEYAVLFGGARGGGKTDALLAYALVMCKRHPGAQVLFVRRRFTDLSQPGAAIPRSQELIGQRGRWNSTQHRWTFPNGSVLKFGHLNDSAAITQYLGTQVDVLLLDQAEQLTEDEYRRLQGSVRATVPGLEPRVRLTANPGGVGHAWVKARFVDAAPPDTAYVVDDGGIQTSHRFVPSRVWDNQRLLERDPRYVQRLQALGGNLARAWLQGDKDGCAQFSSFTGTLGGSGTVATVGHVMAADARLRIGNSTTAPEPAPDPLFFFGHPNSIYPIMSRLVPLAAGPAATTFGAAGVLGAGVAQGETNDQGMQILAGKGLSKLFRLYVMDDANVPLSGTDATNCAFSKEGLIYVSEFEPSPRRERDESLRAEEVNFVGSYVFGVYRPAAYGCSIVLDASTPTS